MALAFPFVGFFLRRIEPGGLSRALFGVQIQRLCGSITLLCRRIAFINWIFGHSSE